LAATAPPAAVAAGAAGVDRQLAAVGDRDDPPAHRRGGAGDLLGRLPLHRQGDQQRRLLRLVEGAVHQPAEQRLGLGPVEVLARQQAAQRLGERQGVGARHVALRLCGGGSLR
jgi:hypothetical protein